MGEKPFGEKPGENLPAVFDAFRTAGSYNGAARLLNERGVAPRRGTYWEAITVGRIIKRESAAGNLVGVRLPLDPRPRSRTLSRHVFSGLLVCPHDGSILTSTWRTTRRGREVGYLCRVARGSSTHPSPYNVSEHFISEWAQAATAHVLGGVERLRQVVLGPDGEVVIGEPDDADTAVEVERQRARRARYAELYAEGDIDREQWDRVRIDVDAVLERLAGSQRAAAAWRMPINWDLPAADLNVRLRDLLHSIRLNAHMRPMGGVWRRRPFASDGSGVWMLDEETGEQIGDYDSHAIPMTGGWFLPTPEQRSWNVA